MNKITIKFYITDTGKVPFEEWLEDLDKPIRSIIRARLARIMLGNFGDFHALQNAKGIYEIRFDIGAGYRIYYGKERNTIIILLVGGSKRTQTRDIEKAKRYWCDYNGIES
ncbi:MAG TPA: type II toxin-antitoxin system RelE/ParE family toxin [Candidatus Babeliales bacterium]|nr:type II toxin-antitoxin system RelE/ParE family toxin [Candidatus Babeliales bacterium]